MNPKIESVTIGVSVKDVKEATLWYKNLLGDVMVLEPATGIIELQLTEDVWLQLDDTGCLKDGDGSIIRLETNNIEVTHETVKTISHDVGEI